MMGVARNNVSIISDLFLRHPVDHGVYKDFVTMIVGRRGVLSCFLLWLLLTRLVWRGRRLGPGSVMVSCLTVSMVAIMWMTMMMMAPLLMLSRGAPMVHLAPQSTLSLVKSSILLKLIRV